MADTVLGAQMYTVREFAKTPADIAKSVKKVRAIGYEAIQVSGLGPIDDKELKKILLKAFEEVYDISKERKISLRTAAYIIAVSRIAKAIQLRGIFP